MISLLLLLSPHDISFQMQRGDMAGALSSYETFCTEEARVDLPLARSLALQILNHGLSSEDPEIQILSLFGAGASLDEELKIKMLKLINSRSPQVSLVALRQAERLGFGPIDDALKSDFLLVRLEALWHLAEKKDRRTAGQVESIMNKLPDPLWPPFLRVLAKSKERDANGLFKKMLIHKEPQIRQAAVLALAEERRDDLVNEARTLAAQSEPRVREAAFFALGELKDGGSIQTLERGAKLKDPNLSLAALSALYKLGHMEAKEGIQQHALQGNLFAIALLGDIEGSDPLLERLVRTENPLVQINASLSLLKRKNAYALSILQELFLPSPRDVSLVKIASPGRSLIAYKAISSSHELFDGNPELKELALRVKEELLVQAVELDEGAFLTLAKQIFDKGPQNLVPITVSLLENHKTPEALLCLKEGQKKLGSPLVRGWCTLALFRSGEEGPWEEALSNFVKKEMGHPLFSLRPVVSLQNEPESSEFDLTPDETSLLLLESFEAFSKLGNDKGVLLLVEAIRSGHTHSRYPLAGLLLRTAQ